MMNGPFEEEGLYTWVYEGSKTKLYLLCGAMLVGALLLCMIQIWPLWLKVRRLLVSAPLLRARVSCAWPVGSHVNVMTVRALPSATAWVDAGWAS